MIADRFWLIGAPLGIAVLVIMVWQMVSTLGGIPAVILPPPAAVLVALYSRAAWLAANARATGLESLFAFVLSVALGLAVAVALSASRLVREAFYPNLVLFQLVPKIALAPLFVFWMGIGAPARLTYAVFISFFPVALATMAGLARTDPRVLLLCRSLTATPTQIFLAVRLPYAMPYFFAGVKVAATMSVIGVVVGELISANEGLGFAITLAESRGETATIFAAIFLLCGIGLAIYAISLTAERLLRQWWRG